MRLIFPLSLSLHRAPPDIHQVYTLANFARHQVQPGYTIGCVCAHFSAATNPFSLSAAWRFSKTGVVVPAGHVSGRTRDQERGTLPNRNLCALAAISFTWSPAPYTRICSKRRHCSAIFPLLRFYSVSGSSLYQGRERRRKSNSVQGDRTYIRERASAVRLSTGLPS